VSSISRILTHLPPGFEPCRYSSLSKSPWLIRKSKDSLCVLLFLQLCASVTKLVVRPGYGSLGGSRIGVHLILVFHSGLFLAIIMSDDRIMNDSTLPKKSSSSSKTNLRQKVRPSGRFGPAEWNRLLNLSKDLAQRKGQPLRRIPIDEIQKHSSVYDGWIVLNGKVYNITPYLAYHPGGQKILKPVLGKDGTALFHKYHPWVNEEGVIGKLLLGYVDTTRPKRITKKDAEGFSLPAPRPPKTAAASMALLSSNDDDNSEEEDIL